MKVRTLSVFGLLAIGILLQQSACMAENVGHYIEGKGTTQDYNRAIELGNEANHLSKTGKFQEALELDKKATSLYPYDPMRHYNLACDYFGLKKFDEAISLLNKAIEMEPGYATAWTTKGECYESKGDLKEADKCYRKAYSIDPNSFTTCFNIGDVLLQNKNPVEAKTWFVKAKTLSNDPTRLAKIEDRLAKIAKMLSK